MQQGAVVIGGIAALGAFAREDAIRYLLFIVVAMAVVVLVLYINIQRVLDRITFEASLLWIGVVALVGSIGAWLIGVYL